MCDGPHNWYFSRMTFFFFASSKRIHLIKNLKLFLLKINLYDNSFSDVISFGREVTRTRAAGDKIDVLLLKRRPDFSILFLFCTNTFIDFAFVLL